MTINFDHVMKMYNTLYCNRTHRAFTDRVGGLCWPMNRAVDTMANLLIDAALECCGHTFYRGAVTYLLTKVSLMDDPVLEGLALEHLLNFATEEHILSLNGEKHATV